MSIRQISDEPFGEQFTDLRRTLRRELDYALFELGANGDVGCARAIERREKRHRIEFRLLQKIRGLPPGLPPLDDCLMKIAPGITQRLMERIALRFRQLPARRLQGVREAGFTQL